MLSFSAEDLQGNISPICDVLSFELSKNIDAACHGLRLNFLSKTPLAELVKIRAYCGDGNQSNANIEFNGYVDTQQQSLTSQGYKVFIYARSSACLLTDNEAQPITYTCPSALSLYYQNARDFGFDCELPKIYCNNDYQVSKGVSCYGAINDFVLGITGYNIVIDSNNVIKLPTQNTVHQINADDVISQTKVVNRGDVVTTIDYKHSLDIGYNHHLTSEFLKNQKINKSQKVNLSALPDWQKEYTVKNKLKNNAKGYYALELVLNGYKAFELYDKINYSSGVFGDFNGYYINKITVSSTAKGIVTKLTAYKNIDLQEINYVVK